MSRVERGALVAYGSLTLAVSGLIAVAIRLRVPDPAELLGDIADRRALWIGANALLIVQQVLLAVAAPAVVRLVDGGSRHPAGNAVGGLFAIAAGALIASGVFHGVLGAHVASHVGVGPPDPQLVRTAELVHALGDTCWFVGLGALTALTAVTSMAWWRRPLRRVARLGAAAVVVGLLQYGWFADHVFGLFAAPATLLQAAWFVVLGVTVASRPPADATVAPAA